MLLRLCAVFCLLMAFSSAAHADSLVYTLSGNFSGTLGGSSFTDTFGTFSETATSSAIIPIAPGFYQNPGSVTLKLAGFAPVNFNTTFLGIESEYNAVSFYDLDSGFAIGAYSDALGTYDLSTAFGPVTGFFVSTGTTPEYSSGGYLTITGATGDLTFTAVPVAAVAATPEPSSLLLLSTGLLGVAAGVRRRLFRA